MAQAVTGISQTIQQGDAVALTTNATYSLSSVPALRKVLAADKTAHYLQGVPVAGIAGVAAYGIVTDANGRPSGTPALPATNFGGVIYDFPGMASGIPNDTNTGQALMQYYAAHPQNVFFAALSAASAAATHALDDTLAGLLLTTVGGVTTYALDTTAAAADKCVIILRPRESDPLYGAVGGSMFFQFVQSFDQTLNGVQYTSQ
jgi:hypothetical protein